MKPRDIPFTGKDLRGWREQVEHRTVDPNLPWRDAEVITLVGRFLATLAPTPEPSAEAAHNHPVDDRFVVEGCPACPWPPEPSAEAHAGLVRRMRYHPALQGATPDFMQGWDAATRTLLDLPIIYDDDQHATDAAMNFGDGFKEGQASLDTAALANVLTSELFADWLRIIGSLGEDDRLDPGFAGDLASALAAKYREEVPKR